ncbi:MAG: GTP-binding protein [Candidatus Diapherotrites archaeon]|nr:GTP-binding protein [Candidatus Diapherotrites archaeon]
MGSVEERINELEEELRTTKYNKATAKAVGILKAKIAKLRSEQELQTRKSQGIRGPSYGVKKTGDATALLVGFPSVGKSTLLNALTNAESKVGAYEFTTINVIPGMMEYKGAKIQLLDVPGIVTGATQGRGRGREVLSVIRNADIVIIIVDKAWQAQAIRNELYAAGMRLDKNPPNVVIKRKAYGGLIITSTVKLSLGEEYIRELMNEMGLHNASVLFRQDVTIEELIDAVTGNRIYTPSITLFNKIDEPGAEEEREKLGQCISISAERGLNLNILREEVFKRLEIARVYMKKAGEEPDMEEPLVLRKDHTISGVCKKIHREFLKRFQYARVWGKSARFEGQKVGLDHRLHDGDVVELHLSR